MTRVRPTYKRAIALLIAELQLELSNLPPPLERDDHKHVLPFAYSNAAIAVVAELWGKSIFEVAKDVVRLWEQRIDVTAWKASAARPPDPHQ